MAMGHSALGCAGPRMVHNGLEPCSEPSRCSYKLPAASVATWEPFRLGVGMADGQGEERVAACTHEVSQAWGTLAQGARGPDRPCLPPSL